MPISEEEWKTIHQTVTIVVHTILGLLNPLGILSAGQPHKKSFFKHHFLNNWVRAMNELKSVAPLTSFCAGTWKADMTLGSVLDVLPTSSVPPPDDTPPSHSSTPSSSLAPSCIAPSCNAPSSVVCSSNMGPPSTVPSAGSSRAAPISCSVSTTSASHTSRRAPHCAAPKSVQLCTPSELQEVDSAPLNAGPPSPKPTFLSIVKSGASDSPAEPAPPNTERALHVKPTPAWSKQDKPSTPTSNPLPPSLAGRREHTPLKTASEGASSELEGIFNLKSLKRDELMDWINDHLTEVMSKQHPQQNSPTQEEIQEIIQNVSCIEMQYEGCLAAIYHHHPLSPSLMCSIW
ncbi:hypothetical protein V8E53_011824 [Lactarius tabidus]